MSLSAMDRLSTELTPMPRDAHDQSQKQSSDLLEFRQRERMGTPCASPTNRPEAVGFLTTFKEASDRVAVHALRRELVEAQAFFRGVPEVITSRVYEMLDNHLGNITRKVTEEFGCM